MIEFSLGRVMMTAGVASFCEENNIEQKELTTLLTRHLTGDWGDLPEEDKQTNDYALQTGERLFSAYNFHGERVYVITERDRTATTILFPDEY